MGSSFLPPLAANRVRAAHPTLWKVCFMGRAHLHRFVLCFFRCVLHRSVRIFLFLSPATLYWAGPLAFLSTEFFFFFFYKYYLLIFLNPNTFKYDFYKYEHFKDENYYNIYQKVNILNLHIFKKKNLKQF